MQRSEDLIYKGFFKNTLMRTEKICVLEEHRMFSSVGKCFRGHLHHHLLTAQETSVLLKHRNVLKCSQMFSQGSIKRDTSLVFPNTYTTIYIQLKKGTVLTQHQNVRKCSPKFFTNTYVTHNK